MSEKLNPNFEFLIDKMPNKSIRYISLEGSTRSGKTYSVLAWIIRTCLDYSGLEFAVTRKTLASLKSTAMKDFFSMLKKWGLYNVKNHNKTEHIYNLNGNIIAFFGADNDDKLRGFSCDILYCNEALELDSSEWLQLKIRTSSKIIIDYNPSESVHYLYDELDRDDSAALITTTYKDNPHLPDLQVKEIEKLELLDPVLYQIYALGKRGQLKGLIFTNWKIVKSMPSDLKKHGYGLDFGFSNDPTALIEAGINGGEIYLNELIYETNLTNPDISSQMRELRISGKSQIIADSAEPKSIKELQNLGHYIKAVSKGQDSIRHSINTLKQYNINVTANSVNLIKELKTYKWKNHNGVDLNEPIDKFNHALDATRYWALSNLSAPTGIKIVSANI
jgi:phage terminase large subunit